MPLRPPTLLSLPLLLLLLLLLVQLFDSLLLLTTGRVVYEGPVGHVEKHFASLGFSTPHGENPADYIMELLQSPDPETRDVLLRPSASTSSGGLTATALVESGKAPDLTKLSRPPPVSMVYQSSVLFQRCLVDTLKDKDKFMGGVVLKLAVGVLVGLVWLNQSRHFTQTSIFPTTGKRD